MTWSGFIGLGTIASGTFTESTATGYVRTPFTFSSPRNGICQGNGPKVRFTSTGSITTINSFGFYAAVTGGTIILAYPIPAPVAFGLNSNVDINPYTVQIDIIDDLSSSGLALDPSGISTISGITAGGVGSIASNSLFGNIGSVAAVPVAITIGAGLAISSGSIVTTGTPAAVSTPNFTGGTMTLSGAATAYQWVVGTSGLEASTDQWGAIGHYWDPSANLNMGGVKITGSGFSVGASAVSGNGFTLSSTGISGSAANGIVNITTCVSTGLTGLLITDGWGAIGAVFDATGGLLEPSTAPVTTYSARDISTADLTNLTASSIVRQETDFTGQRPVFGYNEVLVLGQSEMQAFQSLPMSTTQPHDSVMLGNRVQSTSTVTWVSNGGTNTLEPLVGNLATAIRTGSILSLGTVAVVPSGSLAGSITQTGATSFSSVFAIGDVIAGSGFTGAGLFNNSGNGGIIGQEFTVATVGTTSLTYTTLANFIPVAASGQTGVELQIVQLNSAGGTFGEPSDVEAINMYRGISLANKQLISDPTRILIDINTSVSGTPIAYFLPGPTVTTEVIILRLSGSVDVIPTLNSGIAGFVVNSCVQGSTIYVLGTDFTTSGPSPWNVNWLSTSNQPAVGSSYVLNFTNNAVGFWNQNTSSATILNGLATTASKTIGLPIVLWAQGGSDAVPLAGCAVTYANYMANLTIWFNSVVSLVSTAIYSQAKPPIFLMAQLSGATVGDVQYPLTLAQAQLDFALSPPFPSIYMMGPTYWCPRYGFHWTCNGHRWVGAMFAKVLNRIIEQGEKWLPLYMTGATYRGTTILANFHVPYPPLQFQQIYQLCSAHMFPDFGFTVLTSTGAVIPILSVSLVGSSVVQINTTTAIPAGATIRYADASVHGGQGNICDSDPAMSDVPYNYSTTSGQIPAENLSALNGKFFNLWNWCCVGSVPLVAN